MAQVARLSRTPAVGLQHWDKLTGVPELRSARAALTWPPVTTKKPKTRLHAFHRWREPKSHPRIVRIMSIRMGLTVCSFFDVFDEGHGLMRRRRAPLLHVLCRWCYAATHLAVLHARRQRLPVERPHAHAHCRPGLGGGSLASRTRSLIRSVVRRPELVPGNLFIELVPLDVSIVVQNSDLVGDAVATPELTSDRVDGSVVHAQPMLPQHRYALAFDGSYRCRLCHATHRARRDKRRPAVQPRVQPAARRRGVGPAVLKLPCTKFDRRR